ncbi:uncharacterized protein LOC142609009 [Castanea sativa]|uniref:uncharacterized protein LOC142609009 n=1 Tax=Castanea sativa TaxID=21020 RepID=UPI003F64AD76
MDRFCGVRVVQVARGQNRHADSLAILASSLTEEVPRLIKVELVDEPSINARVSVSLITTTEPCWMDPIIDFLAEDQVPADEKEVEKVHQAAAWNWLLADCKLYRRSFKGPYLQCLHPSKIEELLTELHEGVCGSHVGGRLLAHRAMTQGFWRLQMQKDATEYARKYYFTKRVEAEALANIRDVNVKKFVWRNIVRRFGVPESLALDNGLQLNSKAFDEYCSSLGIKNKLEAAKGRWAEELPNVLWAYRTTPRRSTGKTLFSLTYGAKVVMPTEINLCSARISGFSPAESVELVVSKLNLLEEHRESVTIRLVEYQQKLARRDNRDVRRKEFSVGDLVLRKVVGNNRNVNAGKLAPTGEGPYRVTAITGT